MKSFIDEMGRYNYDEMIIVITEIIAHTRRMMLLTEGITRNNGNSKISKSCTMHLVYNKHKCYNGEELRVELCSSIKRIRLLSC
jgi:hypothetical protein